ncbi:hypothetical protein JOQ06_028241, partial [Pogonophryne albipinna]
KNFLLDVKVQGALVRSRFLNTNAPTSFFFGLETKNGLRRVIHSLLSDTGQEITEPSQIRRRAELQTTLQGMQGRRAPGIDGLSVEFYKAYWDVLSHDLLDVFNESLASGSMPMSCRRAALATRLRRAVEQVIHRDQTYCVPGRSM